MGSEEPRGDSVPSPELEPAERAYEAGDYARARELASGLLEASDEVVRADARSLLARVKVDWVQVAVLAVCTLGFVIVVLSYST